MTLNKSTVVILEVLITLLILVMVAAVGWFLLNLNLDAKGTELKAQMTRLQVSAGTYHARLQYYDGVCQDIGVPAGFRCQAKESAYAVETTLSTGLYYCIDSTGYHGETRLTKGEGTACRHY